MAENRLIDMKASSNAWLPTYVRLLISGEEIEKGMFGEGRGRTSVGYNAIEAILQITHFLQGNQNL